MVFFFQVLMLYSFVTSSIS